MLHMECNKDEAIRAKEIAEKKMQNTDFEGARKTAQRAQQLFPELENISQMLTVCNIHCSARNKICGSEMDWYGILRVDRLADDMTIKKQYRKLALLLHPDKNKFPGAEAAFKLIGEANMVLSDKVKRSLYDSKCRFSMRTAQTKPPSHQSNRNPPDSKQYVPAHLSSSNGSPAFWTTCPICHTKYQYYREFVNQSLRCQNCLKPFIAYDLCAQGVPPRSNYFQPAFPQSQCSSYKVGSQSTGGFPPSHMGSQGTGRTVRSEPGSRTGSTAKVGGTKEKAYEGANKEGGNKGVRSAKADAVKTRESGTTRNESRKRSRKLVVESGESCDTANSDETEDVVIQENGGSSAGQNCGFNDVHHPRRSFRRRHHVSYKEGLSDDDDFVSPAKRSKGNGLFGDNKEEPEEKTVNNGVSKTDHSTGFAGAIGRDKEDSKRKVNAHLEGCFPNRSGAVKVEIDGEAVKPDCNAKTSEAFDDSESDPDSGSLDPDYYECPDPEFFDFDKDKQESCLAVDQIWACYDTTDGMPRFYARIRKVCSPGFRVKITWLEPYPEDDGAINWLNGDLPIACGKFVLGNTEEATGPTFSHQVHCEKTSRNSYKMYPRKGEIWALFKGWDISWSSDPENHRKYNFEIVEVISDFVKDVGIKVGYLDKVEGFVSVFQRTTREGIVSFLIPPSEFLRFSHQVPSFKLIGTEREGIPGGSFELDPASLPCNYSECKNVKTEADTVDSKATGSNPRSPEKGMKSTKNAENFNTPKKNVGLEGKNDIEKEIFKLRRSPRELNHKDKKHNQMNAGQCPTQEGSVKALNSSKDQKYGDFTPSQDGEKIILPTKGASPQSSATKATIPQSFPPGSKLLEEFHNFSENKSEGKFLPLQIWAMYNEDGLPKKYGQIKKIDPFPFLLHVVMLEACIQSKDRAQDVCCGAFRLQTGKARVFSPSAFSHEVKSEAGSKNKFEIYPREGEIWALYKDWNSNMSCSDLKNCNYEIVEVLEDNDHYIKVSLLLRLNGFKSVFKAPRRQRSCSGVMEIPRVELARFSHQIPSFNLREEKDGRLRGCWELDPAAIPGNVLSLY